MKDKYKKHYDARGNKQFAYSYQRDNSKPPIWTPSRVPVQPDPSTVEAELQLEEELWES